MESTPAARTGTAARRASLFIVLSALGFGSIAILTTIALRADAPLLPLLAWRYLIAAVVLVLLAWAGGHRRVERAGLRIFVVAGLAQAAIAVMSLSALEFIPAGTLSFLFYVYPAWVAIIARVRHSEPLTRPRLVALAMSLTGIFVMVGAPGNAALHPVGVALALGSALLYAGYIPMIDVMQRGLSPEVTSMYVSAGAAVALMVAAVAAGRVTLFMPAVTWAVILALALWSTVAAFLFFLRGLAVLGSVRTAIISTVEPFCTALLGAAVLDQPFTLTTAVGGALIAGAVILLQWRPQNGAV